MNDKAIVRLRSFLLRTAGRRPEFLLALIPVVSGSLAQKVINLLQDFRLPSDLQPFQEQVARVASPAGEEWRRLQREVRENLKTSLSKDLWRVVKQAPRREREQVIGIFLDHYFEGHRDLNDELPSRRDEDFSRSVSRRRGIDRESRYDANRDPIVGEPGAHPVGTGVGAAAGAATGTAIGGTIGDRGKSRPKPATRGRGTPKKPSPRQRQVQSGFAQVSSPETPIDPKQPLSAKTRYFYWMEIGDPVAGAIETQRVDLPEEVPLGATIEVALFGFEGGLEIDPEADIGILRLREDGVVEVERQPGKGEIPEEVRNRLLFPVKTPEHAGVARLRCNFYYKQVLVLSLQVEAVVTDKSRTIPPALDEAGRRLRSSPDYVLSRSLSPAHLGNLGEHRFSLMINGDEAGHDFRFFGADRAEWVKNDIRVEALILQEEVRRGREALRMVAWGDTAEWNLEWDPETKYRYNRPRDRRDLTADLARLAYAGYRLYHQLSKPLVKGDREAFERVTLVSGFVQVALKESASLVWPAALLYDIPVDTNAFHIETTEHRLCEVFEAALAGTAPLEECACFLGGCPQRQRVEAVLADGGLTAEAGPVICPSGFWGFRHALGLPVSVAEAPDVPGHILFQGAPKIAIGVSTDPKLHLRKEHEAALQKLRAGLGWEREDSRTGVLKMLKRTKAQLVYFYCHGGVTSSRIPYFEVGYNESGITPDNLPGNGIVWKEPRPLVFINGCHTTALTPEVAINLVSAFVEDSAAAGVIGTEITVFEQLACDFAEACLKRFLNGTKLGEAVRGARLELLRRGNPLGLAYIPFALASLNLVEKRGSS